MNTTRQGALAAVKDTHGITPVAVLAENHWHARISSSRAETLYQAATVAAALLLLMSA